MSASRLDPARRPARPRNLLRSLPFLTGLNLAIVASLFLIGTLAGVAASIPAWAMVCLVVLPTAGLVVCALALWRLLDAKLPARVLALLLNAPAAILYVMGLTGALRVLLGPR